MRNIAPAGSGICRVCWGFIDPDYDTCYKCGFQTDCLDAVVPITYSEHLGQLHLALSNYKRGSSQAIRRYAAIRVAAILWRFLGQHETCVAEAAGVDGFDLVTIVPSSDPERDKDSPFAELTGWIEPIKSRLRRTLKPSGEVKGREFDAKRFTPIDSKLGDSSVLLLDDTWATGGHAQSAAHALLAAGAEKVALVVVGRHVRREFEPVRDSGKTCGELLDALPKGFDWGTCAVH